jgi:hypothetical protein
MFVSGWHGRQNVPRWKYVAAEAENSSAKNKRQPLWCEFFRKSSA